MSRHVPAVLVALVATTAVICTAVVGPAVGGSLPPSARGMAPGSARPAARLSPSAQWSALSVPTASANPVGRGAFVFAVSCPALDNCTAFGAYRDGVGHSTGLIGQLSHRRWTAAPASTAGLRPAPSTSHPSFLPGPLDCLAPRSCVAVGRYMAAAGTVLGAIETEDGGTWSARTAPLDGLTPSPGEDPHVLFSRLDCRAGGFCAALATYEDGSARTGDFLEILDEGTWAPEQVSLSGLHPQAAPAAVDPLHLADVACWAPRSCTVVGDYQVSSGATLGLADDLSAGTWRARTLPDTGLRPPAGADPDIALYGVSCPGPGHCVAVGTYRDVSGEVQGFDEVLAGTTWRAGTLPSAGLEPGPAGTVALTPTKLACAAPGFCTAVGTYRDLYGDVQGFAETLQAGRWTARTLPQYALGPPAKPRGIFVIDALACPSIGYCTATGYYAGASNELHGLIEDLAGGIWTGLTAPSSGLQPAAGAFPGLELDALDCRSADFCVSVGTYSQANGQGRGLAEVLGP